MSDRLWKENTQCPKCKSTNIQWYLSSTKECKDCGAVFRAKELSKAHKEEDS